MNPDDPIRAAEALARRWHAGQVRKGDGAPYATHPARVAELVRGCTDDPDAQAAAWLHDVVEDTPMTPERLATLFNARVCRLVACLTNPPGVPGEPRAERIARNRAHSAAACAGAKTVKACDVVANLEDLRAMPTDWARRYVAEKRELQRVLADAAAPAALGRLEAVLKAAEAELDARRS